MNKTPLRLDEGEHAAHALRFIGRFTWLRATELGRLLYPGSEHSRKYAEKNLRKLLTLRLVVARQLPGRDAGTAYVLAWRGAQFLNDWNAGAVTAYRAGTDWGSTADGIWSPPRSWRHDLMAAGVLACLREERNWGVFPEPMLRHHVPSAEKHPDGLLVAGQRAIWLEVENARKSGRNIDQLVRALARASLRRPCSSFEAVLGHLVPVSLGMVAINAEARDERGRRLNHLTRVESALRKQTFNPGTKVPLLVAWLTLRGVGVDTVRLEQRVFDADAGHLMPE